MSTVDVEITIKRRPRRKERPTQPGIEPDAATRIPRITRLMALAIKFQDMVDRGEVRDYADLARLGFVTRARITQIMNLLNLAPDIQEEVLQAAPFSAGARLSEREVRKVTVIVEWRQQRRFLESTAR